MRYATSLAVLVIVTVMFLFGVGVAQAGWWWNSKIDVEGTTIRTVWGVDGDDEGRFRASIKVLLPKGADATVIEKADNKSVTLEHKRGLACDAETVEAEIRYRVRSLGGGDGTLAWFEVSTVEGELLASGTGRVGDRFNRLPVSIRVTDPTCSGRRAPNKRR